MRADAVPLQPACFVPGDDQPAVPRHRQGQHGGTGAVRLPQRGRGGTGQGPRGQVAVGVARPHQRPARTQRQGLDRRRVVGRVRGVEHPLPVRVGDQLGRRDRAVTRHRPAVDLTVVAGGDDPVLGVATHDGAQRLAVVGAGGRRHRRRRRVDHGRPRLRGVGDAQRGDRELCGQVRAGVRDLLATTPATPRDSAVSRADCASPHRTHRDHDQHGGDDGEGGDGREQLLEPAVLPLLRLALGVASQTDAARNAFSAPLSTLRGQRPGSTRPWSMRRAAGHQQGVVPVRVQPCRGVLGEPAAQPDPLAVRGDPLVEPGPRRQQRLVADLQRARAGGEQAARDEGVDHRVDRVGRAELVQLGSGRCGAGPLSCRRRPSRSCGRTCAARVPARRVRARGRPPRRSAGRHRLSRRRRGSRPA